MKVKRLAPVYYASMTMMILHSPLVEAQQEASVMNLDEMIVTTSGRSETLNKVTTTIQVISEDKIRRSSARSVTDLLAENAVGFFSEWTPAQTSINIRGGATDGQGRDFRSQTLVLVNGRRAGTANISKLSLGDVSRIEIIRGPASVAYGSQAMGGVINIITRNGSNTTGSSINLSGGSWSLKQGHAHTAYQGENADFYFGLGASERDDYDSGRGSKETMHNTAWERRSALVAAGLDVNDFHRFDLTLRTDGIYNAGFRGSSWSPEGDEDRKNHSIDFIYDGQNPTGDLAWNAHAYIVRDVDHFNWENRTFLKLDNERVLDIYGLRLLTEWNATQTTEVRIGADLEYSELRNDRLNTLRSNGQTVRAAPYDNDQDERVGALWGEVIQTVFNDRLTLRAGGRYTDGKTTLQPTKGLDLIKSSENYEEFTHSFGAAYRLTDQVKLRTGYATGFRAPTATELAADFETFGGSQIIGNPNLDNETNQQLEVGLSFSNNWLFSDIAVFDNRISDRITSRPTADGRSTYENNADEIELKGIDLQLEANLSSLLQTDMNWRVFANGSYHFHMRDKGTPDTLNTDRIQRIYKYQAGIGTVVSQNKWELNLTGILRGPVWYDTEERLLSPLAESSRDYVHKKSAFWVWNLRGSYQLSNNLQLFAGINNLLDKNEHPLFIALNKTPYISDPAFSSGGRGNSMPGRELYAGLKLDF
ncbi:TonB-dependent receptor [Methylophaga muralis]|uniref:Colicin I receptor n=1 Tax=Methylophaga muralis TaxID=291169 RepID=A0A1E3GQ69_9GAMM|nr:TonB-dependent receptor [Methylophaga muralis]ODN66167.1 Colicin I receptor precursor [Methylophaga muralis]